MPAGDTDVATVLHRSAAHLLVDALDAPVIDDRDRHHVERVLRLRSGELVSATDGAGGVRSCTLVRVGGSGAASLEPAGDVRQVAPPAPPVSLGFALVKGGRPELIVQKLTELGVDRIRPFVAARSVVRWDAEKREHHLRRWLVVAREAVMQSRRAWMPSIDPIVDLADFDPATTVRADIRGAVTLGPAEVLDHTLLIGPEGGWDAAECTQLPRSVVLSDHVLRAETAAIAAAVLLAEARSRRTK